MDVIAVIVAAGRGHRAGGDVPKQYRPLAGRPLLAWTLSAFTDHPQVTQVVCAIHPDDRTLYDAAIEALRPDARRRLAEPAHGGATRQDSVRQALDSVARDRTADAVCLVHDGARPFVSRGLLDRAIASGRTGAAVPGLPVTDTLKRVGVDGLVEATVDRGPLRAVQTPQSFRFEPLLSAHREAARAGIDTFTDDASLAEWAGLPVQVFDGDPGNIKMTYATDFDEAERRLGRPEALTTRVSTGFDVHVFGPGDHVWLGGVKIPHTHGVVAHSDGDVVLHALTDALLGVLGEGDIGTHFPPSDERWRGAASDQFLAFAAGRVRAAGGIVDHLDATVLCERPKVGPHRETMRTRIAAVAGIPPARVSIKATTTEKLGFTGRGEGIAVQADATVRLPDRP